MRWVLIFGLFLNVASCSYIRNAAIQSEYSRIQKTDPSMLNLKHMIEQDHFFIYGKVIDRQERYKNKHLSIVAFSNHYKQHELVDVMHQITPNTHYGLNLPPGIYDLMVFADLDNNGTYDSSEAIAIKRQVVIQTENSNHVIGNIDITLGSAKPTGWPVSIEVIQSKTRQQSLFYPAGTLRHLSDPLFDREMSTLGMYHPAAFLDQAKTMFYALEEDVGYKIPVIFIHGIHGSARDFVNIVEHVDKTRFKAWFFYYPSGGDLNQMAQFFYTIFLSGKVIQLNEKIPVIIVAHSMGGLVVREALNRIDKKNNRAIKFISLATPFGGHPAAALGEKKGLVVLPSWRDLNPENSFINNLYRRPLHPKISHELIYAYGNPKKIKLGENSDGVAPLQSQLYENVQKQSTTQRGFNTSHVGILQDENVINYIIAMIHGTHTAFPDDHMAYFIEGGFDVPLSNSYDGKQAYMIRMYGKYTRALIEEKIRPVSPYHRCDAREKKSTGSD